MKWIEGFLKKHIRQQAFDDIWKALPPFPGFNLPKKAYREVTQWQGKEMQNLGRCISSVFASSMRNPDGSQQLPFKRALQSVCSVIDFSLMAQYRSHTPETLEYMETSLRTFHRTKDIFLEFRTTKAILYAQGQNVKIGNSGNGLPMRTELWAPLDPPPTAVGGWTKLGLKGPISG